MNLRITRQPGDSHVPKHPRGQEREIVWLGTTCEIVLNVGEDRVE